MATKRLTVLDMQLLQIINLILETVASDPGTGTTAGRIIYRSDTGRAKLRDGSAWQSLGYLSDPLNSFATPTADLAMGTHKITGLTAGTAATDAASLSNKITEFAAPTAALAMNGQKVTGMADGTNPTDAVTKQQLDAAQAGLDVKASVRVATTAAGTLATSFANGQTVDGIVLATGDRILIKNQASAQENGIYTVNASGAPTRATDMDAWAEVPGSFTFVEVGTANADTGWVATADQGGTLNTTAIPWAKFTAAATGVSRFTALVGNGALTSIPVSHNLGVTGVIVQVFDASTGAQVEVDVVLTDTNTVTLGFAVAPASNAYRVVVIG